VDSFNQNTDKVQIRASYHADKPFIFTYFIRPAIGRQYPEIPDENLKT